MNDIRLQGRNKNTRSVLEQMAALLESARWKYDRRLSRSNSRGEPSSRCFCGYEEVPRRYD